MELELLNAETRKNVVVIKNTARQPHSYDKKNN
jgi:hypothetical protein